ncbi:hypothetical protein [Streptomyces sp. NPDC055055]
MEIVIAAVLLGVVPMAEKLIRIAGDRSRARGVAEVIRATAIADLARAHGQAALLRAEAQLPTGRTVEGKGGTCA